MKRGELYTAESDYLRNSAGIPEESKPRMKNKLIILLNRVIKTLNNDSNS